MAIIRGKIKFDCEIITKVIDINGPFSYIKNNDGEWINRKTGQRTIVMNFSEWIKNNSSCVVCFFIPCRCKREK